MNLEGILLLGNDMIIPKDPSEWGHPWVNEQARIQRLIYTKCNIRYCQYTWPGKKSSVASAHDEGVQSGAATNHEWDS